jgi:hypothetical protein
MIQWHKLIGALWKASQSLEINSPLGRRKLRIKVVDLSIDRKMPVMILHRVRLTKLAVGVPRGKDMTVTIPRKPKSTMVNSEVPIV